MEDFVWVVSHDLLNFTIITIIHTDNYSWDNCAQIQKQLFK